MRAFLAAVAMLQALMTGDCLMCERCLATGSSQCSGIFKQCPPDVTHCIKGLENYTVGGNVVLTAYKDCLNAFEKVACGREFFLHTSLMLYRVTRTCCDSDFCNTGDVEVPALDKTPNGYKCKDCFTDQSSDSCTSHGEIQCTGKQNNCVSFSGPASIPGETSKQFSMAGCASQDYCELFYLPGVQVYSYNLQCSPAEKL
ncbi:phospholipase A2 inhibitor and Ly6/PLAUR domain-containing protein-like isoform X2 [Lissotriton helveticus]|uniref:Sodefrin-like factor 15 n=1 Tax=Lissotriton helveticus TaxID=256425 RepID=A0A0B5H6P8_9SALA|nr:sodefrin precursor-like factor 15 [Lissotriton helveticus]